MATMMLADTDMRGHCDICHRDDVPVFPVVRPGNSRGRGRRRPTVIVNQCLDHRNCIDAILETGDQSLIERADRLYKWAGRK
jgi:hypothetical protein